MIVDLSQGFIQILEDRTERIVHDRLADRASNRNGATKLSIGVVGDQRAICLICDVDVGSSINRAFARSCPRSPRSQPGQRISV